MPAATATPAPPLTRDALVALAREHGADDAGVVSIDRPEIAGDREDIERAFPGARTLLAFVVRMNREPIRSTARSLANLEFHHTGDEVNEVGRHVARALEERGVRALNATMGFPMEMDRWPGKQWVVSHKTVAKAAGLGAIGVHRNLIHPKFGNFVLLGTVVVDAEVAAESSPIDFNPCFNCNLCVAACPVGAVSKDGNFDFAACYTHNYREFMGGFADWVEGVVESGSAREYRRRTSEAETVSMWQSLAFGPNYKAAYCMAVCPAGEDLRLVYDDDKKGHLERVVDPLRRKEETLYVLADSDAAEHAAKRFPHKRQKIVANTLRSRSIRGLERGMPLVFQRGRAEGVDVTLHFTFTGREERELTVVIRDGALRLARGHVEEPDVRVTADSETWLGILAREQSLLWALLVRRVKVKGSLAALRAFERCFPE